MLLKHLLLLISYMAYSKLLKNSHFSFICTKYPRAVLHMNHVLINVSSYSMGIRYGEPHTLTSKLTIILLASPNIVFLSDHRSTACPLQHTLL